MPMKPAKKKESNPKIRSFFKTVPKSVEPCTARRNESDDIRSFYIEELKKKLKSLASEDEGDSHESENNLSQELGDHAQKLDVHAQKLDDHAQKLDDHAQKLDDHAQEFGAHAVILTTGPGDAEKSCDECKEWKKKYKDLKQIHMKLCFRFSELEMKLHDSAKTATVHSDTVESTDDVFTSSEIRSLEGIPLDKTKDSTFILQCIEYAYKENPAVLLHKSLKGTSDRTEFDEDGNEKHYNGKDPLTPKKVKRIQELFIARLNKSNTTSVEYAARIKPSYINRFIASGTKNVAKRQN